MSKIKQYIKKNKKLVISMAILFLGNMFMYWILKLFQSDPIYINFYLDNKIPFWGWTVYIYDMFYPFSIVAFFLLYKKDKKAYYKGIISTIIGCIICYIIYLLMPTIMYRPEIPNYDFFTNLVLKITFYFDNPPLNCFPSLHCVFCFQVMFSYLRSTYNSKRKLLISFIAILIILSTLFVKQHYVFDVISALLVCILAMIIESLFGIYNKLKNNKVL